MIFIQNENRTVQSARRSDAVRTGKPACTAFFQQEGKHEKIYEKHPALADLCDAVLSLLAGSFALLAIGLVWLKERIGGRCAIDDEMREILEQMLSAELLLFSFPLHSYGMPAGLKNLVDRMLPLSSMAMTEANGRYVHAGQRDYSHLKFLMICGCGFPNSRRNFEPAGRQYAEAGQIDAALLKKIGSPMIPEETYAAIVNGSV